MNATKLTMDVLLNISHHLSTRSQCKQVNYEVIITSNSISFRPQLNVFPNIHRRKSSDRQPIVEHILKYHYDSELLSPDACRLSSSAYAILPNKLIPGKYVYRSSIDGKRRKWFRE